MTAGEPRRQTHGMKRAGRSNRSTGVERVARPPARGRVRGRRWTVVVRSTLPAIVAVLLLWLVLPRVLDVTWTQIGDVLFAVGWLWVLGLGVLWILGLLVHTIALAAAMPGLSHGRALLLNLTGSCVSDLLPLGGAAGTATNYAMSRTWGFTSASFVRWAAVTNIWDTLIKLVLPAGALLWLVLAGVPQVKGLQRAAAIGVVFLVIFVGLIVGALVSTAWARALGHLLDRAADLAHRQRPHGGYAAATVRVRDSVGVMLVRQWRPLAVGKVGYTVLQVILLEGSLVAVGADLDPSVVFAVFAMERILTMAVLTPGATGFVEVGMASLLVALGGDPAQAAAGVLLYRFFTFAMEIPVGGAGLAWWLRVVARDRASSPDGSRRERPSTPDARDADPTRAQATGRS